MSLKDIAEEYFSQINPIASRIYTDLNETKLAYEDLWPTLSEDEKNELLTESIVKPDILIKYSSTKKSSKLKNEEQYAVKVILDDHCSYRDEHSGPFSFRTQSQRNLHIFGKDPAKAQIVSENPNVRFQPKPKVKQINNSKAQSAQGKKACEHITSSSSEEVKRKVNHRSEVNEKGHLLGDDSSRYSTLPKTGLDFLDNW